jgi:xylan 1,4-beta-xylosidase
MKKIVLLAFLLAQVTTTVAQNVVVNSKEKGEKFEHFWSKGVGAGRANEGLRAGWLEQLEKVQTNCGFEFVRFHGIFHDDMFPVFEKDGKYS